MKIREWLVKMGIAPPHVPDAVKDKLTNRQEAVADKLAAMKGTTRDEVLAEAYRRADRILAGKRQ
jgi:hypothetical protein